MRSVNGKKNLCWILMIGLGMLCSAQALRAEDCNGYRNWVEGETYYAGERVVFENGLYEARITYTAYIGAGWTPQVDSLWLDLNIYCEDNGGQPSQAPEPEPEPEPTPYQASEPTSKPVTLFQHCDFGGYSVGLDVGSYDLNQLKSLGVLNDDISSIAVASGYQVTLYQHWNFTGTTLLKTSDDNCLVDDGFNDELSSIEVRAAAGQGCGGIAPWDAASVYWRGDQVAYNNSIFEAQWWTRGETPDTANVWVWIDDCSASPVSSPYPDPDPGSNPDPTDSQNSAQTVSVSGRQLLVNGQRYRINGIAYSRGGVGDYNTDIALMKEANINTIRTYWYIDDIDELNAFANAGIKIIMHLDEDNFEWYVNTYKNHPAILMWEFGNEFNYYPEWFAGNIWNWYSQLEACAARVHQLDPNHPVSTAHGEVPAADVVNACPSVDVWGMNLYRWDNDVPAIEELAAITSKAIYVSEAGGDSYSKVDGREREDQQALADRTILNGIASRFDICIGVTIFEFCDEWWKAGDDAIQNVTDSAAYSTGVPYDGSADEEFWGIVRRDRSRKEAFYEIKSIYDNLSR